MSCAILFFSLALSLSLLSYLSIPTTNRVECCRIGRSGSFFLSHNSCVRACVLSVSLLIFVNDSNHTNLVIVRTPDREIPTAHSGCVYVDVVVIAFGRQLWSCNVFVWLEIPKESNSYFSYTEIAELLIETREKREK